MFDRALRLSTNFQLYEFLVSRTAPQLVRGVLLKDHQIEKLFYLCQWILQPVRTEFGPVRITSGFRPESLNRVVGGVPTSAHVFAEACDFVCEDVDDMLQVYRWIVNRPYPGEVIYYRGRHIHIALPRVRGIDHQFIKERIDGTIQV
jgi:uncharacterized protein YcbK (DUF882 family)